jgi:predicted HicB family RNase H-like nuclease
MTDLFIAIAQSTGPPDIISGGAGWVGTGLLSSVLAWIFFSHIPAKDKQLAEKDRQILALIESRDALVKEMAATNQEAIKSLTADFRASVSDMDKRCAEMDRERRHDYNGQLQVVVSHCETELSLTNQAIRRAIDEHNALMADLRMQVWSRPHRTDRPGANPPPAPPGPGR